MKKLIQWYVETAKKLSDLPPLFLRLMLAYGFYGPAMQKVSNIQGVIDWFTEMGLPAPALNAYMAAGTEVTGIVLLTLGLATRFISVPMCVVMLVAIKTVHLENGFSCGDNGFEVPFYYLLMLFSLIVTGPGRLSVDAIIKRKFS